MNQEVVGPTRPQPKLGGVPKSTSQDKDGAAFDLASLDRMLHAAQGRITFGLSPLAQGLAFLDWAAHAGNAPFACLGLAQTAMRQWQRLFAAAADGPAIVPPPWMLYRPGTGWSRPRGVKIVTVRSGAPVGPGIVRSTQSTGWSPTTSAVGTRAAALPGWASRASWSRTSPGRSGNTA